MSRDRGAEEPTGPFDFSDMQENMRNMRSALDRLRQAFDSAPPSAVQRGGIPFFERETQPDPLYEWDPFPFGRRDPRQGEEVYITDILPGARVYVLDDVFTVSAVDMDGPMPTVWLKELPDSPLYYTNYESIYLANETED